MDRYIMVMLGAAVGGLGRYAITTAITEKFGGNFPLGTFLVNLSGSFLIGVAMTLITERWIVHPNWRLLLVVGVLGDIRRFRVWSSRRYRLSGEACLGLACCMRSEV